MTPKQAKARKQWQRDRAHNLLLMGLYVRLCFAARIAGQYGEAKRFEYISTQYANKVPQ